MIKKNLMLTLFLLLQFTFWGQANSTASQAIIFINEIHYDNIGADENEGIELAGTAGSSIEGWSLVLYNGTNGTVYNTENLSGTFTDQIDGYGFISVNISGIQNGSPDAIALINDNDEVIQFLSYEGTLTATNGPAIGLLSDDIGLAETSITLATESLQLTGTGVLADFTWTIAPSSFGSVNTDQLFNEEEEGEEEEIIFINEIHYDNAGADASEGIELAGTAGSNIDGWSLALYNGGNGTVYNTVDLNGTFTDQTDGYGFISVSISGIQNGSPDGMALINANDEVIQFLSYEGTLTATDGPAIGLLSDDIGVTETTSTLSTESLQLTGTGTVFTDFTWAASATSTFGAVNNNQFSNIEEKIEIEIIDQEIPETITLIHDIQGADTSSPFTGQFVLIEGIVTGDYQSGEEIFFVQEENSDMDENGLTSEGILVSTAAFDVNEGDLVQVIGTVIENFGNTELQSIFSVTVISTGNSLPAATSVALPFVDASFPERYEGMLVELSQTLTVTSNFTLGRLGELSVSSEGRLFQPTNVANPGEDALAVQAQNDLNQLVLDDANPSFNPDTILFPEGGLSSENTLRTGATITGAKGCLSFTFGSYRVYFNESPEFTDANPRTDAPNEVGGSLKVASFNVLNYFNGDGNGGGFPTARGADSEEEFVRQRNKIINAIIAMDADILGLIEIENDGYGSESAIQDLINGINTALGTNTYAFVDPGVAQIGGDAIAVGFIYKPSTVSLSGSVAILDSSVDPTYIDTSNRPSLLQTFIENSSNEMISISVNHFKSKGSDCDDLGDFDINDGQGNCNLTRLSAAIALTNWLATDPTNSGSDNFLIIGDLNAYAMEDPIMAIQNAGYTNLINAFGGENAYSFQFDGQFGYLDYALASEALSTKITGTTDWHINADEPVVLDYNVESKSDDQQISFYNTAPFRASDHDPVVVGIELLPTSIGNVNETSFVIPSNSIVRGEQISIIYNSFTETTGLRFALFNSLTGKREYGFNDYLAPTSGETLSINRTIWAQPGIYIVQYFNPFTGKVFETTHLMIE